MYLHVTLSIIYIQTEMHKHRPLTCQLVHLSTRLFLARLDSGFHGSRHSHGRTRQESSVGGVLEPWQREWIRHEPRSNGRLHTFDPTRTKTARSSCSKPRVEKHSVWRLSMLPSVSPPSTIRLPISTMPTTTLNFLRPITPSLASTARSWDWATAAVVPVC